MARLDRLCLQDDDDDGLWDENGHEQQAKLFEWVLGLTTTNRDADFLLAL